MHASASGPLGALLMIAPLAAIPVFAVFGVPQFAPVVASPADEDEETSDLGEPSSPVVSEQAPRQKRSPDDLFADLNESSADLDGPVDLRSRNSDKDNSIGHRAAPVRSTGAAPWSPPVEALDDWEIRPDKRSTSTATPADDSGRAAPRSAPDEDHVSTEGFKSDLLQPESDGARGRKRSPQSGATPAGPRTRNIPKAPLDSTGIDDAAGADPLGQMLAEQSGWQAAARRLKELGIRKYRLVSQIETQNFVFVCSFALSDNPRIVRRFEADADNPLEAVQSVLQQIDEWRSREDRGDSLYLPDEGN